MKPEDREKLQQLLDEKRKRRIPDQFVGWTRYGKWDAYGKLRMASSKRLG